MTTNQEIYEGMNDYIEHLQEKEHRKQVRKRKLQENRKRRQLIKRGWKISWEDK